MYKNNIATFCCFLILGMLIFSSIVIAKENGNGMPKIHGMSGKEFGQTVKNVALVHEYPRAVTDFIHQYNDHPEHPEHPEHPDHPHDDDDDNGGGDDGNGDDGNGDDGNGDDGNGDDGNGDDGNGDGSDNHIGKTSSGRAVNIPPVADASAGEPYIGFKDENIEFNGSFSYDADGYIINFIWEFNDGTIKNGEIVTRSFKDDGDYEVVLTVTDNDGAINSTLAFISIVQPNNPPTAPIVEGVSFGIIDSLYDFSVVSYDFDDENLIYYVDWGDGIISESLSVPNGTEVIFKYAWDSPGDYTISVKSFDGFTFSETTEFEITIGIYTASTVSDILFFIVLILILVSIYLILSHRKKEKPEKMGN